MNATAALQGLRTTIYAVPDLDRAKAWYVKLLEVPPYFDEPFYVGFNVGGFELGLIPNDEGQTAGPGGTIAYWGVDDIDASWKRALSLGATAAAEPQGVGGEIKVAVLSDPFGNRIGLIYNPEFPNTA